VAKEGITKNVAEFTLSQNILAKILRPLFLSLPPYPNIYPGRKRKGDAVVVGCLLYSHAPQDGRGADQALVGNRLNISMLTIGI
jgi:hypothetical protein